MNNKEILNKIDEIISLIENSLEYQKYLSLKKDLDNNKEIILLINEIKVLQKDVVHHFDKKEILNKKLNELESIPLYREYQNTVVEINNVYSIIESRINNYINSVMN